MSRIPRVVVPGLPHHIARLGNRGLQTFFNETDYQVYRCLQSKRLGEGGDLVASTGHLDGIISDWKESLEEEVPSPKMREIERHIRTGRPLGSDGFVRRLEGILGRRLRPGKRGRKPVLRLLQEGGESREVWGNS